MPTYSQHVAGFLVSLVLSQSCLGVWKGATRVGREEGHGRQTMEWRLASGRRWLVWMQNCVSVFLVMGRSRS